MIGGNRDGRAGGREIDGVLARDGGARNVVAVVAVGDEDLPVFGDLRPVVLDAVIEAAREVERSVLDFGFHFAKGRLSMWMLIKEDRRGPAPGVCFVLQVRPRVVLHNVDER